MATVALSLGVPDVITLGLADVAQEVTYPLGASVVRVYFRAAAGKYYPTGTDGAAIHADAITIPSGQWFEIPVPGVPIGGQARNLDTATREGFFASATASAVFEIVVYS